MDRQCYLSVLQEQIRTKRARQMVKDEIEAHIEDQKSAFLSEGMTETEAEEAAVKEMGDPVEAGAALDRIHRPAMNWSVFAGIVLISILGVVLQAVVLETASPAMAGRGIWGLLSGGARTHAVMIIAGIILMLVICRVDYSLIGKYAVIFWILINAILIICIMTGEVVNGRPRYLAPVSYLIIPFYAGILYHFRGHGKKGLLKSVVCLCVPLIILIYNYMLSAIIITGFTGLVLIHAAIYKGWFGSGRKRLYLSVWGVIAGVIFVWVGAKLLASGGNFLADYQVLRIAAWLHPAEYADYNYTAAAVADAAEARKDGSSQVVGNMINIIRNDYLWLFLCRYLGTGKGILITALVVGFWGLLFRTVLRQKNQLGYIVSLGCVLCLSTQTAFYMAMNFRILPTGSAYMPFLSNGNSFLLVTYFYMGILLSVCRNRNLVKN